MYGTIKKGFSNHFYVEHERFLGKGKLLDNKIFVLPNTPYPFVEEKSYPGAVVHGEVYQVQHQKTMDNLDYLESHPDFYRRTLNPVKLSDGRIIKCWVYRVPFENDPNKQYLPTGIWTGK